MSKQPDFIRYRGQNRFKHEPCGRTMARMPDAAELVGPDEGFSEMKFRAMWWCDRCNVAVGFLVPVTSVTWVMNEEGVRAQAGAGA